MKIALTGSHGFIGRNLSDFLKKKGFEARSISRFLICGNMEDLASSLAGTDVVVHLAGAPVMQRWTKRNRQIIHASRVVTTWNLVKAMDFLESARRPKVFISISAVGIYAPGNQHDEHSQNLSKNFLGAVVTDWENASTDLDREIRRVIFRSGVVLGKDSQMVRKVMPFFKLGLGGKIGNGKQPFPFIHIDDLVRIFYESMIRDDYEGVYNLVAPEQAANETFTKLLSRHLNRPAFFRVPPVFLKMILGEASATLLEIPAVVPGRLTSEANYQFRYPTLSSALLEILNSGHPSGEAHGSCV